VGCVVVVVVVVVAVVLYCVKLYTPHVNLKTLPIQIYNEQPLFESLTYDGSIQMIMRSSWPSFVYLINVIIAD
jgi:hypothetical protein